MRDKIIIAASGGFGDVACSTCLLYHREELWPGMRLIWYIHPDCKDILKFNDKIDEVRVVGDPTPIDTETSLVINTAPWGNPAWVSRGVPYAQIPMRVVGKELEGWHPYLCFSKEEDEAAGTFVKSLPYPKTVILETTCRSGQSSWLSENTSETMRICRSILGPCNFLFASKSGFAGNPKQSLGFEASGVAELGSFTIRQCIPIYNRSHLMVGISSGLSCSFCAWQASQEVERVEFVYNSKMYGTWPMARGPLSVTDNVGDLYKKIAEAAQRIKAHSS